MPETVRVPADIVVSPVYVLFPDNNNVPSPVLKYPTLPVIIPPYVSVTEESVWIVLTVFKVIPLLLSKVKEEFALKVPPSNIKLSASIEPGVAPRLALEDTLKIPSSMVVVPEYVLVPDNKRVPG